MISDRSVDAVAAHGCQEDHQRAEAIAEEGDLAVALREVAYGFDGVLDILCARVSVINPVQTKAVLPVGLGGDSKVDLQLLPPEQVWCDRKEALFRQFVAVLANVGVHSEQLLQNNDCGSQQGLRPRDIGGKRSVTSFDGDAVL